MSFAAKTFLAMGRLPPDVEPLATPFLGEGGATFAGRATPSAVFLLGREAGSVETPPDVLRVTSFLREAGVEASFLALHNDKEDNTETVGVCVEQRETGGGGLRRS